MANRLKIPVPNNGLQQILKTYHAPTSTTPASPTWLDNFSKDVVPVPCHAHNDYWHRIPLYEALAAGCTSVEADIYLGQQSSSQVDLFVGHDKGKLSKARTLQSLYLTPLLDILENQNREQTATSSGNQQVLTGGTRVGTAPVGVYDGYDNTTVVLLLDFKTDGAETWPTVTSQLEPLRKAGFLSHWTAKDGFVSGPITVVGTGNAPFDLLQKNSTYRDVFYDAPLEKLAGGSYNSTNSYLASVSLKKAVGTVHGGKLSDQQKATIETQVKLAESHGLKSRYWDTPSWPVSWRNRVWEGLVNLGVGYLNVDDLTAASRWDWNMCVVGGLVLCN